MAFKTLMSSTPVTQSQAAVADADSVSQSWFRRNRNLLLFSLVAAIYLLPFMRFYVAALLESGAVRLMHGAVFAKDFVEDEGPGSFWWNALFMRFFGADFFGARVCLFVTSLGTGIALYYLAAQVCRKYAWLPAVAFVASYFGGMWPLMSYHTDSNLFALLGVVCVVFWYDRGQGVWLWFAGFMAAVASYMLQPRGLYLYVAIVAWMLLLRLQKKATFKPIAIVTASYAVCMSAGLLYFWSQGALGDLIYDNLVWPATRYSTVNTVPYGWGTMKNWREFSHPVHGSYFFSALAPMLTAPYFFIDALPFLLAILVALRWKDAIQPKIALFLLCGGAIWFSEFHRKELGHLACGSPLFLVVFCYFLLLFKNKPAEIALQLVAICSVALATFNFLMVIGAPPLHTRVGTIWTYNNMPELKYLQEHTKPGEDIFCFQYCPSYYFLDQNPDPTRFNLLTYGYYTKAQFEEAISEIQQHKVKYVVWQGGAALKKLQRLLPGSNKRPPYGFLMDDYLHSRYHEVTSFANGMQIWERNGDE
jgi:hypothetical protein